MNSQALDTYIQAHNTTSLIAAARAILPNPAYRGGELPREVLDLIQAARDSLYDAQSMLVDFSADTLEELDL